MAFKVIFWGYTSDTKTKSSKIKQLSMRIARLIM